MAIDNLFVANVQLIDGKPVSNWFAIDDVIQFANAARGQPQEEIKKVIAKLDFTVGRTPVGFQDASLCYGFMIVLSDKAHEILGSKFREGTLARFEKDEQIFWGYHNRNEYQSLDEVPDDADFFRSREKPSWLFIREETAELIDSTGLTGFDIRPYVRCST